MKRSTPLSRVNILSSFHLHRLKGLVENERKRIGPRKVKRHRFFFLFAAATTTIAIITIVVLGLCRIKERKKKKTPQRLLRRARVKRRDRFKINGTPTMPSVVSFRQSRPGIGQIYETFLFHLSLNR